MKIKVNAIGLGDANLIKLSEILISLGIVLSGTGLILLRKSQCWKVTKTPEHFAYLSAIVDALQGAFNKK